MTSRKMVLGMILGASLMMVGALRAQTPPPAEEGPAVELPPQAGGLVPAKVPESRDVFLTYYPDREPPDCLSVLDDPTHIWLSAPPWRVQWVVRNPDDAHQWVIQYKDGDDVLPAHRVVIPCSGDKAYRSGKPSGTGTWTYKVSVYECAGGKPASEPACETDPQIIIWP